MEQLYWKDIFDGLGNWAYLEFEVPNSEKPNLCLKTGPKKKFLLEGQKDVLFWGRVEVEWYGAWFLRNENQWEISDMIIPPITSVEVKAKPFKKLTEKWSLWSKYFVSALQESKNSLLFPGTWRLNVANRDLQRTKAIPKWEVLRTNEALDLQNPLWIDWGGCGGIGELLPLKSKPSQDNGRVKWYRKLVKEGKCPPVVCWFIHPLDASIILDGHCRLQAFIEENKSPEVLVLASLNEMEGGPDPFKRKILQKPWHKRNIKSLQKGLIHY